MCETGLQHLVVYSKQHSYAVRAVCKNQVDAVFVDMFLFW